MHINIFSVGLIEIMTLECST